MMMIARRTAIAIFCPSLIDLLLEILAKLELLLRSGFAFNSRSRASSELVMLLPQVEQKLVEGVTEVPQFSQNLRLPDETSLTSSSIFFEFTSKVSPHTKQNGWCGSLSRLPTFS
jgi:hypothetical protein